jgi:hypothetical protein
LATFADEKCDPNTERATPSRPDGPRPLSCPAVEDPHAKEATLKIAEEYERLAMRAAKRMEEAAKKDAS